MLTRRSPRSGRGGGGGWISFVICETRCGVRLVAWPISSSVNPVAWASTIRRAGRLAHWAPPCATGGREPGRRAGQDRCCHTASASASGRRSGVRQGIGDIPNRSNCPIRSPKRAPETVDAGSGAPRLGVGPSSPTRTSDRMRGSGAGHGNDTIGPEYLEETPGVDEAAEAISVINAIDRERERARR